MKRVEIEANPNSPASDEALFSELDAPRTIRALRATVDGAETLCDVIGVERGGVWVRAFAQKIADSGEGCAFLITGGGWGIRLRPARFSAEPWALSNPHQWGEPYKIYGSAGDLVFE